jgi:hypothetical protein
VVGIRNPDEIRIFPTNTISEVLSLPNGTELMSKPTLDEDYLAKALDIEVLLLKTRDSGRWILAREIETLTGVNTRTIADIIRKFQECGFPVISSANGYKWARTKFEFFRHLAKERTRFRTGLASVSKAARSHNDSWTPTLFEQE